MNSRLQTCHRGRIMPAVFQTLPWGLLFLLLFSGWLRLWNIEAESAWIDEAYSIILASQPITDLIRGTAADQHPPLYYLLLHFWLMIYPGLLSARLFSLTAGLIHIFLIIRFGEETGPKGIGWAAGIFLGTSTLHIWYSQEARMYILLALLTTGATILLWDILEKNRHWLPYALVSLLSVYTHYFAFFILFSHALIVLWWASQNPFRKTLKPWGLSLAFVFLGFSPWLPIAHYQTKHHVMSWIGRPSLRTIRDAILQLIYGDISVSPSEWFKWFLFLFWLLLLLWAVLDLISNRKRPQKAAIFSGLWGLVPLTVITLAGLYYPLFQLKQLLLVLAPLVLLLAITLLNRPRLAAGGIFLLFLVLFGGSIYNQKSALSKDNWRSAAAFLQTNVQPDDVIYANPAAAGLPLSLYWKSTLPFRGYPPDYHIVTGGWKGKILTAEATEREMRSLPKTTKRIWLVEFFPQFWDPEKTIERWLDGQGKTGVDQQFGNIRIRLYPVD